MAAEEAQMTLEYSLRTESPPPKKSKNEKERDIDKQRTPSRTFESSWLKDFDWLVFEEKGDDKATNPAQREEDWELINEFCEHVNHDLEGPQVAVRLIAHKVQSPQEREALFALSTLEACVRNCGKRFHQEIGKFRFLNEIIKVISPKYLGNKTTDKVKTRCIELIYSMHKGLSHEMKITEAYSMLKAQGIVKHDPTYMDKKIDSVPPPEARRATFEDEEKSRLLAKLLKSKNPDDLQAANRLIKNMVRQDSEKMDKISRRINELETIHTNVKLLSEMLSQFGPDTTTESEKEMMKELYESLEKLRPKLFRLASDTDEMDTEGLGTILKANDEVSIMMARYKKEVEGIDFNGQVDPHRGHGDVDLMISDDDGGSSLVDIDPQHLPHPAASTPGPQPYSSSTILDDELLSLGLQGSGDPLRPGMTSNDTDDLMADLDNIFSNTQATQNNISPNASVFPSSFPSSNQIIIPPPGGVSQPMGQPVVSSVGFSQPMAQPVVSHIGYSQPIGQPFTSGINLNQPIGQPIQTVPNVTASVFSQPQPANLGQGSVLQSSSPQPPMSTTQRQAMQDLDVLGQTLMQQSFTDPSKSIPFIKSVPATKVPMNQLATRNHTPTTMFPVSPAATAASHPPPLSSVAGSPSTTVSTPSVPTTSRATDVLPLTDVFVALDTIQPGTAPPVTAFDKGGVKLLIHLAKDRPRDDVMVMVVSVMSTNTAPIQGFVFQAAVPKVMKVKLQPPSATDLPAFNPILPAAAITQVMLVANPSKEKIRLKFKITYTMNGQSCSEVGDVDQVFVA